MKLSFFGDIDFARVAEPERILGCTIVVASLLHLGAAKLDVMLQRTEKKDYEDVAAILDAGLSLAELIGAGQALFGRSLNALVVRETVSYCEGGDLAELSAATRARLTKAALADEAPQILARVDERLATNRQGARPCRPASGHRAVRVRNLGRHRLDEQPLRLALTLRLSTGAMRRPRRRLPDHLVEVTVRCLRSEMRLVPHTDRVRILGFTLAQACQRHPGVQLLAVCQMSNHLHLVLRDDDAELSSFMQYFLGNLARRFNRIDGIHGPMFERRFAETTVVDDEALVHRIAYAIANPVEADLVRSHRDWTGLCAFARANAMRRSFTYFHEGRYRRAVTRAECGPEDPSVRRTDFVETATLEMGVLDTALAGRVEAAVKAREARLRETQRGVVGMAAVKAVPPLARPASSSRSPMPLCFASTEEGWSRFVAGWRAYLHAFYDASLRFRRGVLDAAFPEGAFRPPCWAG